MTKRNLATIPAGRGCAVALRAGQRLRVITPRGTQVVDLWAFASPGTDEFLSMAHCREVLQKIVFGPGDTLITNRYRPILRILADTSPGDHDTLIAACNPAMYARAGCDDDHTSCAGNLDAALAAFGLAAPVTPSPWNLFMRAPVIDGARITYQRPRARPGDYVELAVEIDCLVAFSACPDDVYPTNGGDGAPTDARFMVLDGRR